MSTLMAWLRRWRACECCGGRADDETPGSALCGACDTGACCGGCEECEPCLTTTHCFEP